MAQSKEERNKKAVECMAEYRKTEAYQRWLIESRERRKALKEKYRRERGCKPRTEIADQKKQRAAEKDRQQEERRMFRAQFVGPPRPKAILNDAEYQRWRYRRDGGKYQKMKRGKHISQCSESYVAQQLGVRVGDVPKEIVDLKREQILFSRVVKKLRKQIKEVSNGE